MNMSNPFRRVGAYKVDKWDERDLEVLAYGTADMKVLGSLPLNYRGNFSENDAPRDMKEVRDGFFKHHKTTTKAMQYLTGLTLLMLPACVQKPVSTPTPEPTPQYTQPPTETPESVITAAPTLPPTTEPPKPPTPVSDYAVQKGVRYDLSALEPTLEPEEKQFVDYVAALPQDSVDVSMTMGKILEDGKIADDEIAWARLSSENPTKLTTIRGLLIHNLTLDILKKYDSNLELVKRLFESMQPSNYMDEHSFVFLGKFLGGNVPDQYLEKIISEGYVDWEDESPKLDLYMQLSKNPKFLQFSVDAQRALFDAVWVKDGIDQSDLEYINKIPLSFNPKDKGKNTDGVKVVDYYEIMHKGDVNDKTDDSKVVESMIKNMPSHVKELVCSSNVYDRINPLQGKTIRLKTPIDIYLGKIKDKEVFDAIHNYETKTEGLVKFNIVDKEPSTGITVILGGGSGPKGEPSCGNVVTGSKNPLADFVFHTNYDGTINSKIYIFLGSSACNYRKFGPAISEHEVGHALGFGQHFGGFYGDEGLSFPLLEVVTALYSLPPGTDMSVACTKK